MESGRGMGRCSSQSNGLNPRKKRPIENQPQPALFLQQRFDLAPAQHVPLLTVRQYRHPHPHPPFATASLTVRLSERILFDDKLAREEKGRAAASTNYCPKGGDCLFVV